MAPASIWGGISDVGWALELPHGSSAHILPLQQAAGSNLRPSISRMPSSMVSAAFDFSSPCCKGPQHRPAVRSSMLAVSFEGKEEGAASIEEKEGKDANGDPLQPDVVKIEDLDPQFHGTTPDTEQCRCLAADIERPRAQWLLRKAVERGGPASRASARKDYHKALDDIEFGVRDKLKAVYAAERYRDYAFQDLHAEYKYTEGVAAKLAKAFAALKDAYSEGDCARAVDKAEEHGEEVPECHKTFQKAAKDMKEIRALIAPECKMGALELKALQSVGNKVKAQAQTAADKAMSKKESNALPPSLFVALSLFSGTSPFSSAKTAAAPEWRRSQRHNTQVAFRSREMSNFL